jgi:hypothetical protein
MKANKKIREEVAQKLLAYLKGQTSPSEMYGWAMGELIDVQDESGLIPQICADLGLLNEPEWYSGTGQLYRYYVDCLLEKKDFDPREARRLSKVPRGFSEAESG